MSRLESFIRFLMAILLAILVALLAALPAFAQSITYGGFDITTASFTGAANNPFSVASEGGNPRGIAFSNDGLRMFIVDAGGDHVSQYDLTQAFDITTATFTSGTNNPFSVADEDRAPLDIAFSDDGLRMFVVGNENDAIIQYDLTTAFDVTTASFTPATNNPFSVAGEDGAPSGITFSNDGFRMLILGNTSNEVNQYDLTSAFDITTASFTAATNNPFLVANEETTPYGMTFSNSGLHMFITGANGDEVNQYDLTTAFDVTTASFTPTTNNPFSVSSEETVPTGVTFSNNGLHMFIVGRNGDDVNQYEVDSGGTFTEAAANDGSVMGAMNISIMGETFTSAGSNLIHNTDYSIANLPSGFTPVLEVGFDGSFATLSLAGNSSAHQDIDDLASLEITFSNSAFTGGDASVVAGAIGASTGFAIDYEDNPIINYGGFDITTASFTAASNNPFSVAGEQTTPTGITFSNDGLRMFISGDIGDEINQYELTSAFDVTTATFTPATNNPFIVGSEEGGPTGMTFSNDGLSMYIVGNGGDEVNQYALTNAFDVTTASFTPATNNPYSVLSEESFPTGITFSTDGMRMFIVGATGEEVNQYDLTTAFDITTASFTPATNNPFSVASETGDPHCITFTDDGLRMFLTGGSLVFQYDLTSAFDITTASFTPAANNPFSVASEESSSRGIRFSTDGRRMLIVGRSGDEVNQYDLTGGTFLESAADDGSITRNFEIFISGETFTNAGGTLTYNTDYSISNLPAGLTPVFEVGVDGSFATLSLSGNATNHDDTDDVSNLEFTFTNSAFTGGNATVINGAISASSGLSIDFEGTGPLPVELVSFQGMPSENGTVILEWQTASELNNDFFELRHSLTGQSDDFMVLETLDGQGTTNALTNYEYRHMHPAKGFNYYQLRQVDFDGAYEYSDIILVSNTTTAFPGAYTIFPNPVRGKSFTIKHDFQGENLPVKVQLMDISGKNVFTLNQAPQFLEEELTINLPGDVQSGTFLLTVQLGVKLIVERLTVYH